MSRGNAEFEYDGIHLVGASIAGAETYVVAPEMDLSFDLGRCPLDVLHVSNVFLSHGHMDHAAGAAYYFSQRMFIDNEPGKLFAAAPLCDPLRRLMDVWGEIDGNIPRADIRPAIPGVDIALRRDLCVRPFEVNHGRRRLDGNLVTALGYAAIEIRKKLKPEYHGLAGPQLVELKKKGIEITARTEVPLVTYCGDTANGDFFDLPYVRDAKVLLLECTFVDDDHRSRARAGFHIHSQDLRDIVPRLRNEKILLTHLTRRTPIGEAMRAVESAVGAEEMSRISFLMSHRRRLRPPETQPKA
ncbi:MAG: MBL fold metallo-hydrolase [Phycisphaerae bacterium]